ncbi:MAG: hypothetical protein QGI51_06915, partial [Dehalococcoidales bacterium]|nr:hypothetical protein [Dehalococcoidales bacterium]
SQRIIVKTPVHPVPPSGFLFQLQLSVRIPNGIRAYYTRMEAKKLRIVMVMGMCNKAHTI